MKSRVQQLEKNTARLITSNQIILSPYNVVKELVENSLDAGANQIEVRLENYGLDKIEVKDNGKGVQKDDVERMFLPGHSSKIKEFSDIGKVSTYGFRGEALGAICCVGLCTVTTKTEHDTVANCYDIDSSGNISKSKPSPHGQGTTVTVSQLFCHQPARRRMLMNGKSGVNIGTSKSTTITNIRNYLGAIGIAWPQSRISLVHNKSLVWRKQPVTTNNNNTLITALGENIGHSIANNLKLLTSNISKENVSLNILTPKIDSNLKSVCQSTKTGMIIIVNKKIIHNKKIESAFLQVFNTRFPESNRAKYPICLIDFTLDSQYLDINLEPDKSKIILNSEKEVLIIDEITRLLSTYYGVKSQNNEKNDEEEVSIVRDEIDDSLISNTSAESLEYEPVNKKLKVKETTTKDEPFKFSIIKENNSEKPRHTTTLKIIDRNQISQGSKATESKLKLQDGNDIRHIIDLPVNENSVFNTLTDVETSSMHETSEVSSEQQDELGNETSPEIDLSLLNTDNISDKEAIDNLSLSSGSSIIFEPSLETNSTEIKNEEILNNDKIESQLEISEIYLEAFNELEKLYCDKNEEHEDNLVHPESQSLQSAWSRGQVKTTDGEIKSSTVLTPKHTKLNDNIEFKNLNVPSPCSQMGFQELNGFSIFCKERRPQILQSEPGMIFTKVAQMLARQWKELPMVEKERYGELGKEYKQAKQRRELLNNLRDQVTSPIIKKKSNNVKDKQSPAGSKNKTPTRQNKSQKSSVESDFLRLEKIQKASQNEAETSKIRELRTSVNLGDIKKQLIKFNTKHKDSNTSSIKIIGEIDSSLLIKQGNKIQLFKPSTINEESNAEYEIPVTKLNSPINFKLSDIGWQAWRTLTSLDTTWDIINNETKIKSKLITNNGFYITFSTNSDKSFSEAHITHMSDFIQRNDALINLKELLLFINDNQSNVFTNRPNFITQYLKGVSNKNKTEVISKENIIRLLNEYETSVLKSSNLKEVLYDLYELGC